MTERYLTASGGHTDRLRVEFDLREAEEFAAAWEQLAARGAEPHQHPIFGGLRRIHQALAAESRPSLSDRCPRCGDGCEPLGRQLPGGATELSCPQGHRWVVEA